MKSILAPLLCLLSFSCFSASAPQDTFIDTAHYDDGDKIPYLLHNIYIFSRILGNQNLDGWTEVEYLQLDGN